MWTGRLSIRRAVVLISELPHDSRLATAMRGGAEHDGWDVHSFLLAGLIDAVNQVTHAVAQTHSKRRIRRPAPVPRPGSGKRSTARTVRVADLAARQRAA
ncbi:MAG: hypothetical protein ACRDXX_03870 [Stackebrandtia sp.]